MNRLKNLCQYPFYKGVFTDLCGESSLKLIQAFPTPAEVLSAAKEDIFQLLKSKCQRKGWAETVYQKLITAAKACLPYNVAQQSNIQVLREYVMLLMTQQKIPNDIQAQIVAAAKEIPVFHLLLTIPGVGNITAATIVAEIKTVALIATSNKLLRIIYGMWRKNEPFRMN